MRSNGFLKDRVCRRCLKKIEGRRVSYAHAGLNSANQDEDLCPNCELLCSVERSWMPLPASSLISKIFFISDKNKNLED